MGPVSARLQRLVSSQDLIESGDTLVVAVSGGADSLCLLHLLAQIRSKLDLQLQVAHLDQHLGGCVSLSTTAQHLFPDVYCINIVTPLGKGVG